MSKCGPDFYVAIGGLVFTIVVSIVSGIVWATTTFASTNSVECLSSKMDNVQYNLARLMQKGGMNYEVVK